MDSKTVNITLQKFDGAVSDYRTALDNELSMMEADIHDSGIRLRDILDFEISGYCLQLVSATALLYQRATYHYMVIYRHHSPSFVGVLSAIFAVITFVWKAVQWAITFFRIKEILQIIDVLKIIWPEFRKRMDKIYLKVSEVSKQIGWGVDGIAHMLNAAQSGLGAVRSLAGKDDSWLEFKFLDKSIDALTMVSKHVDWMTEDPSGFIRGIVNNLQKNTSKEEAGHWSEFMLKLSYFEITTGRAVDQFQNSINELQAIQVDMPDFIADHIPATIWEGLARADNFIDVTIMPALREVDLLIQRNMRLIVENMNDAAMLAYRLARPGQVLLGVDDLPDWAKDLQLELIDDVASRKLQEGADNERAALWPEMVNMDLISDALTAPLPPPIFMTQETPGARSKLGIIYEPAETWFMGDY